MKHLNWKFSHNNLILSRISTTLLFDLYDNMCHRTYHNNKPYNFGESKCFIEIIGNLYFLINGIGEIFENPHTLFSYNKYNVCYLKTKNVIRDEPLFYVLF